jgi:hypothetical protein
MPIHSSKPSKSSQLSSQFTPEPSPSGETEKIRCPRGRRFDEFARSRRGAAAAHGSGVLHGRRVGSLSGDRIARRAPAWFSIDPKDLNSGAVSPRALVSAAGASETAATLASQMDMAKKPSASAGRGFIGCSSPGAHPALLGIFGLLAKSGEALLLEALTYPGTRALPIALGLKLVGCLCRRVCVRLHERASGRVSFGIFCPASLIMPSGDQRPRANANE